jgi:Tfp pilus assembly protein FimT
MTKNEDGFSVVEMAIVGVIVIVIGVVGFSALNRKQSVASVTKPVSHNEPVKQVTPTTAQPVQTADIAQNIDSLISQDSASESAIDTNNSNNDQATAQSANGAASDVGGSYDESSL